MECEKCESLLLDELYEELDELTSAAVKRHVAGCARCTADWDTLRTTRRLAVIPMVAAPVGLEDRIMAAFREQQKVVPIPSGAGRALSWAGRWAMKPQTAMAAVFLLMIGTSAFLIRNKQRVSGAPVSVQVQGQPETTPVAAAAPPTPWPDPRSAASAAYAHGAAAYNAPPPASSAVALNEKLDEAASKDAPMAFDDKAKNEGSSNAAAIGGASTDSLASASQGASAPAGPSRKGAAEQDGFSSAMASYRARNYVDATRQFDSSAAQGDQNAALWAAKSVKDGNGGCAEALRRFESVAQRAAGQWLGSEAQLEAARCQIELGQLDAARANLNVLTRVSSHAQQAQETLKQLDAVAARRAGGSSAGGTAAPRPAQASPAGNASPKAVTPPNAKPADAASKF